MKNKPTGKQSLEDKRLSTKDLFKFLKEKLSPSCPEIKETTKEEEKLHFIYKQFHDNPYYGPIFKEIYLGYFSEQDLNDSPSGLIFSENLASMKDDELDLLYNYYIKSVVHWILVLCTENQDSKTNSNDHEKHHVILIDPKTNELINDQPEYNAIDFVYSYVFDHINIDDYYKETLDLLTLMKSLPKKDTMRNFQLLRLLLKNKDTKRLRNHIALFSPLGMDFTKRYVKEINVPDSIKSLMLIVNKISILLSVLKDNINNTILFIRNNFSKKRKKKLISLCKIEYYDCLPNNFCRKNKKTQKTSNPLNTESNLIFDRIQSRKIESNLISDQIQSIKTEVQIRKDEILSVNTEVQIRKDEILSIKTEQQLIKNKIDYLQKQIDFMRGRDQFKSAIDFFTTPSIKNN